MDLAPGDYYVIVDGYKSGNAGFYSLTYRATPRTDALHPPSGILRTRAGDGAHIERGAAGSGISGRVHFQRRTVTTHGLSSATTDAAVPYAWVEATADDGTTLATTETDEDGAFRLAVATGTRVRVRALSRTVHGGNDLRVVSDPGTERAYEVSTLPFVVQGDEHVDLEATVGGVENAGAFNILTQFGLYLRAIEQAVGRPLAPLFAFWRRGNNHTLPSGNITAFLDDYHRHPGTFALQIQGGDPGREDQSDSDQFDNPVILHEFSHFVLDSLAGDFSIGGRHPDGELKFPGLALNEGSATALACMVAGDPRYWDTHGLEPLGSLLVDEDIESGAMPDRGIGSQNSSQQVLWDLADGDAGLADRDHDGVAIGLAGVLRVFATFRTDATALPALPAFVERVESLGAAPRAALVQLVHHPVDHGFAYPVPAGQGWPLDLSLPAQVTGRVDGLTQPAPSGGQNSPSNGLDAIRTYRFRVERRTMIYVDLSIDGNGSPRSATDLDLELRTRTLDELFASSGTGPRESIRRFLEPGTYIVFVRDGSQADGPGRPGAANRAGYTLSVRASDTFR